MHYARARNAYVYNAAGLSDSVEGARHERIVLHGVAEHHELGAGKAALVRRQLRSLLDRAAHQLHGIHIDACFCGTDVDRGADLAGSCKGLRDRRYQRPVAAREPLLYEG